MPHLPLRNHADADPKAQAVFDDIMARRGTDYVNHIWRALANEPPMLERLWNWVDAVMAQPSRIDPLTKELIYLAVSMTNNCEYCINSHSAAARTKGMDDGVFAELLEIVALANATNRIVAGLQLETDARFMPAHAPSDWVPPAPEKEAKSKRAGKGSKGGKKDAKTKSSKRKTASRKR